MKCPICDGGGRITSLPSGMPVKCTRCNGTGEVTQTEEEWLKSLNTKQLAKWIDNLLMRCNCHDCNFCPIHKEPHCTSEGIEEWLKQPHREETEK